MADTWLLNSCRSAQLEYAASDSDSARAALYLPLRTPVLSGAEVWLHRRDAEAVESSSCLAGADVNNESEYPEREIAYQPRKELPR